MVYAMTNAAARNEIVSFRRGINGRLTRSKVYSTGGRGTGEKVVDPLVSQGSLVISHNGRLLFVVNARSDSISSFRVANNGTLTRADVKPSGGIRPNSLAVHGNLLYISNVGNAANNIASNITGFRVQNDGRLTRIMGATYSLSTADAQPACVVFSPSGRQLVVSELNNNRLSVFHVNMDGTLTGPTVNNSNGEGPFGAVFLSTGLLLVAEAGTNALSSYRVTANGKLDVISGSIRNGQQATCWVAVSKSEHFAYTSNTGSNTITTYRIKNNGKLAVVENVASTRAGVSAGPIDSEVSKDGRNFYVLNGSQGSVSTFRIRKNGRLLRLQVIRHQGLPRIGAQGLAVR